jgi:hypothetical protein
MEGHMNLQYARSYPGSLALNQKILVVGGTEQGASDFSYRSSPDLSWLLRFRPFSRSGSFSFSLSDWIISILGQ